MKATLYEALGIPQAASDEEVRAALRRLIRKYYAKTRDGQGNVEEALRFINHASRILSDSDHRQRYDQELAVTTEATTEIYTLSLHDALPILTRSGSVCRAAPVCARPDTPPGQ